MIFLSYRHTTNQMDKKIKKLVKTIKEAGINITQTYSKVEDADYIIVVIENIWQYIKNDHSEDPQFDYIMQDMIKHAGRYIFITYEKPDNYNDLTYVKNSEVLFLDDDLHMLIVKLKKAEKPRSGRKDKLKRTVKLLNSAGILTLIISMVTIVANFVLKASEIPVPHFEIKWRYLSAYQYSYITRLDNVQVEKKAKPAMDDLISERINDNVIVGVITLRNIGDEFPDNTIVHLERIQGDSAFQETIDLKTIAHNNYIMIPVFITEEFTDDTDLIALTKDEIWDKIDYRLIFKPTNISYDKPRFWNWQKEAEVEVKESSDVLSKIRICLDESDAKKNDFSEENNVEKPHINKYMITGQ